MKGTKPPLALIVLISLALPLLPVGSSDTQEEAIIFGSLEIDARIENHYAVTTFTGHISNPTSSGEDTTISINVPEDAMISNLSITIDGVTSYAVVAPRSKAQQDYEEAREEGDTATQLRASADPTLFHLDLNIRSNSNISFSVRYEQVLVKKMHNFTYMLPVGIFSNADMYNELDVLIDIQGMGDIIPVSIQKGTVTPVESWITTSHTRYTYNSSLVDKDSSIVIVYQEVSPPINGTLRTYIDDTGGYFIHVFSPQLSDMGAYLPKNVIFVLDRSGSMMGRKIEQLKDAFSEIVYQVHDEDRFNIISFSSDIDHWNAEMVPANRDNKDSSVQYLDYMDAMGTTNIEQALLDALAMYSEDKEAVPIVVFLTDGLPTEGVTNISTIREDILYANQNRVSIYSLGFGEDLDFDFLSALSLENRGFAVKIPESDDASILMQGFYETISVPLLREIYFNYTAGASDVIPQTMPSLFAGSEAVVVGRFDRTRESITSTVTASSSKGPQVFEGSWKIENDSGMEFIPRLWAHRMILHYLERMLVEGETEFLQQKVIDLAMEHSFVTPYTSFILIVKDPNEPLELDDEEPDQEGSKNNGTYMRPGGSDIVPSIIDYDNVDDDDGTISDDDYEGDGDLFPDKSGEEESGNTNIILLVLVSFIVIPMIVGLVIFGYTRIRREDLLNQENRKKIYEHITNNPGEHFRGLQRAVDLEVGVLSHHLNVLEKEQLIVSEQDGSNRRFWAAGVKHDMDQVHLSRIQENILREIQDDPGITQSQIAKNMGVSRKVIFYHVKFLRNAGVVREEKDTKNSHYYER